jgi:hypothetical protein
METQGHKDVSIMNTKFMNAIGGASIDDHSKIFIQIPVYATSEG